MPYEANPDVISNRPEVLRLWAVLYPHQGWSSDPPPRLYPSLLAAGSVFVSALVSLLVSVVGSALPSSAFLSVVLGLLLADDDPLRLSVLYQPEPLKTIGAGRISRRTGCPHVGQVWRAGSLKDCRCSN